MPTTPPNRCSMTIPLQPQLYHIHKLDKRFRIIEKVANSFRAMALRRLKNLERTHAYRELRQALAEASDDERQALRERLASLAREARLDQESFVADIEPMQKSYPEHIHPHIAEVIATDVWCAINKRIMSNGEEPLRSEPTALESVTCRKPGLGMSYRDGFLIWTGGECEHSITIKVPVRPPRNDYEKAMLAKPILRLCVIRREVKNEERYYLQFVCEVKSMKEKN